MTLRQFADWILYGGGVAAALAAIGFLMRWMVVNPLKRWIVVQTKPARQAAGELTPNGGGSARDLLQQTSDAVDSVSEQITRLAATAVETGETAKAALTLARQAHERMDRHLVTDHAATGD